MLTLKKILTHGVVKTAFAIYFGVILLLVVFPFNDRISPDNYFIINLRGDYFLHILAFSLWPIFGLLMQKHLAWWLLYGILFAVFTESLQFFLPYRSFNINDLIFNSIGIVIGYFFVMFLKIFRINLPMYRN